MRSINLACTIKTPGGETLTVTREDLEEMAGVMGLEVVCPAEQARAREWQHLRDSLVYAQAMKAAKPSPAVVAVSNDC